MLAASPIAREASFPLCCRSSLSSPLDGRKHCYAVAARLRLRNDGARRAGDVRGFDANPSASLAVLRGLHWALHSTGGIQHAQDRSASACSIKAVTVIAPRICRTRSLDF